MEPVNQAVLLDTDVYSALFVLTPPADKRRHRVDAWESALLGRRIVIAFQTRAEVLVGALSANWGERKLQALISRLDATPTVQLDADVLDAYLRLTVHARRAGRGIGGKIHVGDRWIAACAIAKSIPLLSGDGIFTDAPSLRLHAVPSSRG